MSPFPSTSECLWGVSSFPFSFGLSMEWCSLSPPFGGSAVRLLLFPFSFGGCMGPLPPLQFGWPRGYSLTPPSGLEGEPLLQELARCYVAAMSDMEGRKPGPTSILGEWGPRVCREPGCARRSHTPNFPQALRSCDLGSLRAIASPSTPPALAVGLPCAAWPSASGRDRDMEKDSGGVDGNVGAHIGTAGQRCQRWEQEGVGDIRAGGM